MGGALSPGLPAQCLTPLIVSSMNGHEGVVVELIKAGAEVTKADPHRKFTALHSAAQGGHLFTLQEGLARDRPLCSFSITVRT